MTERDFSLHGAVETLKIIAKTMSAREFEVFKEKYLTNSGFSGPEKVKIRKQLVNWQAELAEKRAAKRRELEKQRMLAELEAESKPVRREPRTLSEKMQRKGWSKS